MEKRVPRRSLFGEHNNYKVHKNNTTEETQRSLAVWVWIERRISYERIYHRQNRPYLTCVESVLGVPVNGQIGVFNNINGSICSNDTLPVPRYPTCESVIRQTILFPLRILSV